MANQVLSEMKETAQWIYGAVRPWGEFLDPSAFSSPSTHEDEGMTRFAQNITRFRSNYAIVLTVLLALTMITRPLAVLAFLAVAWLFFLSFAREDPLTTVFILFSVAIALRFQAVPLGIVFVLQHALWRGTDDLVADHLE
ncbi:PRA1 family protein D [Raphanus sativus]|uniref:PRA1 family protein n=1 Tax=Raphanus sativus TaxID=3726 RepID=A0A6J0NY86_RAPSA|nr:PRA1 family protein D [Raphanus sativus]KAJ4895258.1 PRA1 family protein D [Raphanus sativus]